MLKVQSNSRQVPSVKEYTANKKYNDLLYGVLQEMSYIDSDKIRYVNKSDINYSDLGNRIKSSRQTASTRFKSLIEIGLISFVEDEKRYKLNYLDKSIASLVPFDTLKAINDALSQNSISIYVYLLKRFLANQEKEYIVTMKQMKEFIGITSKSTSNNSTINNILNVLSKIGLVEYELVQTDRETRNIVIKKVNNVIKK